MALIPYLEPQYVGNGNFLSLNEVPYVPAQNAIWRRGGFLIKSGTTNVQPTGGTGTLVTAAGPISNSGTLTTAGQTIVTTTNGNTVTITAVASAGAQAQSYYVILTFVNTAANESLPGPEFIVNCGPGIIFSINVSAAGAPAAASNYASYVGVYTGNEYLQTATRAGTALGTAQTLTAPLAYNQGVTQAATNSATNIVGIAVNDSNSVFYNGPGGSTQVGNQSLFGATQSQPPVQPAEAYLGYVAKLQGGVQFEMSLINTTAWYPSLTGSAFGLTLDAATGIFVANPAGTQVGNIVGPSDGVNSIQGTVGDFGKRVIVNFLSSVLI